MTDKKDNNTNEVEGEKSENVVHLDKDGADEVKKLKATLTTKKSTTTRYISTLKKELQPLQVPLIFTTETILQPLKLP